MKSPKILTQNRPKYMKLPKILPEISTPNTNRGGQCPPPPHLLRLCPKRCGIFDENIFYFKFPVAHAPGYIYLC